MTGRIKNYTSEDLEKFLSDPIMYKAELIDLNSYAYHKYGFFRELIDFYVKPVLYRWYVGTRVTGAGFGKTKDDKLQKDYVAFAARIHQLNLGRELHNLLLKVFLEDAVFGWWLEDGCGASIYYLPSRWCLIDSTVNGSWSYKVNAPRITDSELKQLPEEIREFIEPYKKKFGKEAYAPVPFEKAVCFKYNDYTNTVFPPFTYALPLMLDLNKSKQLNLAKNEMDATNYVQMRIPIDDKDDDHLRFTEPIISQFANGLRELLSDNSAILPTPFELTTLDINKNASADKSIISEAVNNFNNETGTPRFGDSKTAAEMKRALENAAAKVFVILDQISDAVNLKMKIDGYVYAGYEFTFEILHMNQFNKQEVQDLLLKQSQAGSVNKFKVEASFGSPPVDVIGQYRLENVVFRDMFDNLMVPPSSHTKATTDGGGGRPALADDDLTAAGEQSRADNTNDAANRNI